METIKPVINPIPVESSEISAATELYNFTRILNGRQLSDFNLMRIVVLPGQESEEDQHAVKEYWYVAKGEGILKIDGDTLMHLQQGQVYFFDSQVRHLVQNTSAAENLEILSIWW